MTRREAQGQAQKLYAVCASQVFLELLGLLGLSTDVIH